jgi:alkanesulfonate monooxygenase SsuD/methylene tetrahydromethanopterin reductase-like flavin-dependent oxidoreductase (luciferase family)
VNDLQVYGTAMSPHREPGEPMAMLTKLATLADRHGFDGMLVFYDHESFDPWAISATLMQHSSLVPLVALQPYTMPPFTAAKLMHSLSSLYGRRIDLNMIIGAAQAELQQVGETLEHDARYERMVEYVKVIRGLLTAERAFSHEGRYYRYQGLQLGTCLPEHLQPRVFVAGSSPAARQAAQSIADVAITLPEPLAAFVENFVVPNGDGPALGIRIGIVARPTDEEAWTVAHETYPQDRSSRRRTVMRRNSESEWSRRLATIALEGGADPDVYWTGAFSSNRGSQPLFVGSYQRVAEYLHRYLAVGVTSVLLGGLRTEADFEHAGTVLSMVRAMPTATRTGAAAPS